MMWKYSIQNGNTMEENVKQRSMVTEIKSKTGRYSPWQAKGEPATGTQWKLSLRNEIKTLARPSLSQETSGRQARQIMVSRASSWKLRQLMKDMNIREAQ